VPYLTAKVQTKSFKTLAKLQKSNLKVLRQVLRNRRDSVRKEQLNKLEGQIAEGQVVTREYLEQQLDKLVNAIKTSIAKKDELLLEALARHYLSFCNLPLEFVKPFLRRIVNDLRSDARVDLQEIRSSHLKENAHHLVAW